ncbi:hypothetical protein AMECASPLE_003214 [Ameca splendens]|uniref:Uncharacterized protein n=1 Tax=Ameca splendens TaxID=208324 RepID=A0ABV0XBJ6_9TELE
MRTHKNTHTHIPNVRQTTMDVVPLLTLPIHTLYSQVQVPIPHRGNQPQDPGGGPLPSGGGDRQTAPAPAQTSAGTAQTRATPVQTPTPCPNPIPSDPHPHPERGHVQKKGSTWSKQARHRMKQSQPPEDSDLNPMSPPPPMNPNMNFPTGPPPTRTKITNTCP